MNAQGGVCWVLFQFFWTSWWGTFFLLFPNCLALFSLFGSFSSSSLLQCAVCFFRVARSPPFVLTRTSLTCLSGFRLSTVSLGRMSWTHSFSPDPQRRSYLSPPLSKQGCGTGGASPSLQHLTISPQCQTGSHSVTPCGKALCALSPVCQEAEQQSRLFTLTIHTISLLEIQAPYSAVTTPPQGLQSAGAISVFPSLLFLFPDRTRHHLLLLHLTNLESGQPDLTRTEHVEIRSSGSVSVVGIPVTSNTPVFL